MSAACAPTVCSTPARLCPGPFSWVDYDSPSVSTNNFTSDERCALPEIAKNPKSLGLPNCRLTTNHPITFDYIVSISCDSGDFYCCFVIRCGTGCGSMDLDETARKMSPVCVLIYVTSCPTTALEGHSIPISEDSSLDRPQGQGHSIQSSTTKEAEYAFHFRP